MNRPARFSDQLLIALKPVLERLEELTDSDPALRAELRRVGQILIAFANEPQPTDTPPVTQPLVAVEGSSTGQGKAPTPQALSANPTGARQPEDEVVNQPAGQADRSVIKAQSVSPQLTKKTARTHAMLSSKSQSGQVWIKQESVQVSTTTHLPQIAFATALDLRALAQRCAIKCEGATWAVERQRQLAQGIKYDTDLEVRRQKLIEHAQSLPDCYLWMCQREPSTSVAPEHFEHLAGCFDATVQIVILLDALTTDDEAGDPFFEPALKLAAEAQAALHNAVVAVKGIMDNDQTKLFQWLKAMTHDRQIHIRHYMTKRNSAKPAEWAALNARIQTLATQIQQVKQVTKQRQKLLSKVRHRRRQIEKAIDQERLEDWQRLDEAVNGLIESGLPPSSLTLREQLLPVLDLLPAGLELSKNFQLVLREIDRFLATRPPAAEEVETTAPIEEVVRVRTLLRGHTIVLIGGERRPAAAKALMSALALHELIWIEGHDQTYMDFEPQVARPEVTLVLLAIRWSRHGFGEVKEFCDRYDKPLVRLLGGYNPNQVAYTILNQVGHRLG